MCFPEYFLSIFVIGGDTPFCAFGYEIIDFYLTRKKTGRRYVRCLFNYTILLHIIVYVFILQAAGCYSPNPCFLIWQNQKHNGRSYTKTSDDISTNRRNESLTSIVHHAATNSVVLYINITHPYVRIHIVTISSCEFSTIYKSIHHCVFPKQ